jgi:iron-sulfur cluster assembly accessory protein
MLQITERAVHKVMQLLEAEKKSEYGLRVSVQGGGCSGFQYGMSWENEQKPDDRVLEFGGLKVYVDAKSELYLDGVKIDYVDSLQESGFRIENPGATGTCGCGNSFCM